jgi:hypothetical protein
MLPILVASTQADWDETTMSKIKGLFQKAWAAVANPGQDERVAIIVSAIERGLSTQRRAFDLDKTIEPIEYTITDLRVATKTYYERLLQRFWSQGVPDAGKQSTRVAPTVVSEELRLGDISVGGPDYREQLAHHPV